ncbi:MAG: fumarylacetoacetate hydrolase family protein [Alphaproteobacteria bacterium]|nr:fumarylacetoacetate hydrolase family protein [Alphaproteobacteria bacterium]
MTEDASDPAAADAAAETAADIPPPDFSEGARILAEARANDWRLEQGPRPEPSDTEQAYDYQRLVTDALGYDVIGWKVGATNPAAQSLLGAKEPFVGPIYQELTHTAEPDQTVEIASAPNALRVTEAEFAFTLSKDLPPRGAAYGFDEVAGAIAGVHPAIEVVNKRLDGPFGNNINWVIADGGANHAFVIGPAAADLAAFDLSAHPVSVMVNGVKKTEGSGGAVMGNPIMVLAWLATHLSNRGLGLQAGDIISTGLTTPVFQCAIGDTVIADFGAIGSISLKYV